ncbi:MAG: sulfoacetaldehyde acetyltransferase [Gammaproteobacteria bacterium]|nr:sulfoacetaldehyde acetyltransferase [Gammaproteobacteria bacterium]
MTPSEALVEVLASRKVKNVFGIVGSAYMDALDIFPAAGIRFIPTVHEQGSAHMADGYSRVTGKHGVCIAQNGPGITNFVTAIAAAYWAHSPVVAITPETSSMGLGLGGFQETEQLPIFSKITKYQAHVTESARMAEFTARAFDMAKGLMGPTQLNIPRNKFYGEIDTSIPAEMNYSLGAGDQNAIDNAVASLSKAKNPVILSGGGVVMGDAVGEVVKLAEYLEAPVVNSYLHNDSFPANHKLWCGPLGYQGSKAAMKIIKAADVVLVIGSRLGPFGTLPQHGLEYWPKKAKIIQIDADRKALGLVNTAEVIIEADAKPATVKILQQLKKQKQIACLKNKEKRLKQVQQEKAKWEKELDAWGGETDKWSKSIAKEENYPSPRQILRELEKAMPEDAMVSTDIGNICSVSNSYLRFNKPKSFFAAMSFGNCGYAFPAIIGAKVGAPKRPAVAYVGDGAWCMSFGEILTCVRESIPVTSVVFNNGQWGAEKKNQVDYYGKRFLGSNLKNPSFAEIAKSMGAEGIRVDNINDVGESLDKACSAQRNGKTTILEIMCSKELGDPFRRDALQMPKRLLSKYKKFQ